MNAVPMNEANREKLAELDAVLANVEAEKQTCRLEIHVKDGIITGGSKFLPKIFKQ